MPHVPDPALEQMDDDTVIIAPSNGAEPNKLGSVVRALRSKRAELAVERTTDVNVPGYGGMLVLRCGPIPGAQFNRLVERATASKSKSAALDANSDLLIAACREIWGRERPGGELVLFAYDDGEGEPMRLGRELAETLQLRLRDGSTPERARDVVLALFSAVPSPEMAIGQVANDYVAWATDANQEIDEELLGES